MTPEKERRLWWRAVNELREAETLAKLGAVAGPADAPPAKGEEDSWVEEWAGKAKDALKEAHRWLVEAPSDAARDRARELARRLRDGADVIKRVHKKTSEKLNAVREAAQNLWLAGQIGGTAALVLLALIAWYLWKK